MGNQITVLFFANLREVVGMKETSVDVPDGTTVVRLDNLNNLCGSTDIYSCATPNCDFTGEIRY